MIDDLPPEIRAHIWYLRRRVNAAVGIQRAWRKCQPRLLDDRLDLMFYLQEFY